MPHFGLIDEEKLGPVESLLMRARLHIRGARRRLQKGKISLGIITLDDALYSAMQWYLLLPEHQGMVADNPGRNFHDDKTIFMVLTDTGVLDGKFDYNAFNEIVERAFQKELSGFSYAEILSGIESIMTQLGVMPFDEDALPPEHPEAI